MEYQNAYVAHSVPSRLTCLSTTFSFLSSRQYGGGILDPNGGTIRTGYRPCLLPPIISHNSIDYGSRLWYFRCFCTSGAPHPGQRFNHSQISPKSSLASGCVLCSIINHLTLTTAEFHLPIHQWHVSRNQHFFHLLFSQSSHQL